MGIGMLSETYKGKRVFITGHTGFKGSWLALWLTAMGATVAGYALDPVSEPNHWQILGLDIAEDCRADIRDVEKLKSAITSFKPDIVFHMAAQPLVRESYRQPLETWSVNVMGTANLLEACRDAVTVKAIIVITTDKCYENIERDYAYKETDPLGGYDPYSASKAGTELVAASYRRSFYNNEEAALVATARAGNVIGGGDWSQDRLIPDIVRAVYKGEPLEIRSPNATRPWQHVLDALHGYLLLGERLLNGEKSFARAWNFGPDETGNCRVVDILSSIKAGWPDVEWLVRENSELHEATLLQLDSSTARRDLNWQPVWSLQETLAETASWYQAYKERGQVESLPQLKRFIEGALT